MLFLEILKKQLLLKGVITEEDWDSWYNDIVVDYQRDNHFVELKNMDILRERLQTLDQASQYVGEYFSKDYVMKHILNMGDDEIDLIQKQIQQNDDEPPEQPQNNQLTSAPPVKGDDNEQ